MNNRNKFQMHTMLTNQSPFANTIHVCFNVIVQGTTVLDVLAMGPFLCSDPPSVLEPLGVDSNEQYI